MTITNNELQSFWYATVPVDIDLQDDVDLTDFGILAGMWKQTDCNEPNWCDRADVNQSGEVGLPDAAVLAENWLFGLE